MFSQSGHSIPLSVTVASLPSKCRNVDFNRAPAVAIRRIRGAPPAKLGPIKQCNGVLL
jgi:hypothetical protein